jgi:hypothetical protein
MERTLDKNFVAIKSRYTIRDCFFVYRSSRVLDGWIPGYALVAPLPRAAAAVDLSAEEHGAQSQRA